MGGGASVQSLWSPEEEMAIKRAKMIQKRSAEYVVKYFFEGVPTKTNKHSQDPLSPVFVQPDDGNAVVRAKEGIDHKYLKLIPTTVMLGSDGLIRVIFMDPEITYNLTIDQVEEAHSQLSMNQTIRGPAAPLLHEVHKLSLDVYWDLPYPPGIAQVVEVQYAILYSNSSTAHKKRSERVFKSSRGGLFNGFYGSQWLNWTQKRWSEKNFLTATLEDLEPGTGYLFRMRFRSGLGWSEFSDPSVVCMTLPDVPSKPKPVFCMAKTPNSVLLSWAPPDCCNGAPILGYVLEGRSVGDDFIELYSGPKMSYIVFSLFPEFAYSFRVAAVNSVGRSLFSELFSVQTPPRLQFRSAANSGPASRDLMGTVLSAPLSPSSTVVNSAGEAEVITPVMGGYEEAMKCRQAWKECWDERSQSFFYFNMMTGVRQRFRPDVWDLSVALVHRSAAEQLGLPCEDGGEAQLELEPDEALAAISREITDEHICRQRENELRNKKFVLYKALSKQNGRGDGSNSNVNSANYTSGHQKLSVRRKDLLLDAYKYIIGSSVNQLKTGRLQVDFDEEEGIDSGGLSKEFFLLVSRLAKRHALDPSRQYILDVDGAMFFKNRIQRIENLASGGNSLAQIDNIDSSLSLPRANVGVQASSTLDGDEDGAITRAEFFYFLGRFMAKALLDRQFVDLALSPIVWKHILSMPVVGHSSPLTEQQKIDLLISMDDLKALDGALSQSLLWIMNNSIEGIIDETFAVQLDVSGEMVPLCKGGDTIAVTNANKREYVDLIVKWRTEFCVKTELDWFVRGFCEVVPRKVLLESNLSIPELSLILNGKKMVDVEEIRAYTIYQSSRNDKPNTIPFGEHTDSVSWLWMMLRKISFTEQCKFLLFVTGTSCIPLDGYNPPFNITEGEDMCTDSLPRAHTCFNQIVLPEYSCYEILREKIMFAVNNTEGFALS